MIKCLGILLMNLHSLKPRLRMRQKVLQPVNLKSNCKQEFEAVNCFYKF